MHTNKNYDDRQIMLDLIPRVIYALATYDTFILRTNAMNIHKPFKYASNKEPYPYGIWTWTPLAYQVHTVWAVYRNRLVIRNWYTLYIGPSSIYDQNMF